MPSNCWLFLIIFLETQQLRPGFIKVVTKFSNMKETFLRSFFLAKFKGLPLKHFCFGDMTFYRMNGKNGLEVRVVFFFKVTLTIVPSVLWFVKCLSEVVSRVAKSVSKCASSFVNCMQLGEHLKVCWCPFLGSWFAYSLEGLSKLA